MQGLDGRSARFRGAISGAQLGGSLAEFWITISGDLMGEGALFFASTRAKAS